MDDHFSSISLLVLSHIFHPTCWATPVDVPPEATCGVSKNAVTWRVASAFRQCWVLFFLAAFHESHPPVSGLPHFLGWWWLGDGLWNCFNHMSHISIIPKLISQQGLQKTLLTRTSHDISAVQRWSKDGLLLAVIDGIPYNGSMGMTQDPIHGGTLVPYFGPYFAGDIPWNLGLKNRPKIYGRYLHFRILKFPLIRQVFSENGLVSFPIHCRTG